MPFTNSGFEVEGASPWHASGWTFTAGATAERFAEFGTNAPKDNEERFESEWSSNESYLFAFDPFVDIVAPVFDDGIGEGETYEDFEEGWDLNHGYSFDIGSPEAADFDTTPQPAEDFEEEWASNESYDFAMGSTTAASFDSGGESVEDFEEGWFSGSYVVDIGTPTAASFDSGGESVEDFEETYGPITPSAINYGSSGFSASAHGLSNGDIVRVMPSTIGGLMPLPLQADTNYYVVGASTNAFQLAATSGGSAITLTAAGFGVSFYRNPATHWPADGPT